MLWFAFYYWWRIQPKVAFYVSLLVETIKDLRVFLLFYIMIIIAFTTMTMVLDEYYHNVMDRGDEFDYTEFVTVRSGDSFFDSFLMMWSLGIGDFNLLNYDKK